MKTGAEAVSFLKAHYQEDTLNPDQVRADEERMNWIMGNPVRFPHADLGYICRFSDAASAYLSSWE